MATKTKTTADLIIEAMKREDRSKPWTAEHSGITYSRFTRNLFAGGGDFHVSDIARIARALRVTPRQLIPDEEQLDERLAA